MATHPRPTVRARRTDSVAELERATGIPSATLRVWERRYGFPQPQRDSRGHRTYDGTQLHKLQLVARLIARGERPGRLLGQSAGELQAMLAEPVEAPGLDDPLLPLLQALDVQGVTRHLLQHLEARGLEAFVCETVAGSAALVGQAWSCGRLQPHEEHLYTECAQQVLRTALAGLRPVAAGARPRVLLATLTGEQHGLGLLMVQVLLAREQCASLPLGLGLAPNQIAAAAARWAPDAVALSVSEHAGVRQVLAQLLQLRSLLPKPVALWLGGGSRALARSEVAGLHGVRVFRSIAGLPPAVREFRQPAR